MKKWKKISVLTLISTILLTTMGCGRDKEVEERIRIGIVSSSGGFGDGGFNDMAVAGARRAEEEFGIIFDRVGINASGDIKLAVSELATMGDYDLIIALTFDAIDAIDTMSKAFPEQKFAILDTVVEGDNIASYITSDEEASFLLGATAALMKQDDSYGLSGSKKIGFVGGMDVPNIQVFRWGYAAGAKYIDQDIEVIADYVGSFVDATTAKEITNAMYRKQIDVVFPVAGTAGNGVLQAAKESDEIAFGVNLNQNEVAPDNIPGSLVKRIDVAAYEAIKSIVEDTFVAGVVVLDLANVGVDFETEGSNIQLRQEVQEVLTYIRELIYAGEITIPTTEEEMKNFHEVYDHE